MIFRRKRNSADFSAEIQSHIQHEIERLRAQGLSDEDARRSAHLAFGNVARTQERFYESRRWLFLDHLWHDLRFAARMPRKSPGFTAVAILTLALGIGANTAIFTLVETIFWRALPYPDAGRLIFLTEATKSIPDLSVSYPDFLDWQKQLPVFDGIAAYQETNFDFDKNGQSERISGRNISPNFLELLGLTPALGRDFVTSDDQPGAPAVFISSYRFWQTHLGENPNAVGAAFRLDGRSFTLIGVLPRNFNFETPADVYTPIGSLLNSFLVRNRAKHPFIYAVARLNSRADFAEAQTELHTVSRRLQQQYPASNAGVYALARPLQQQLAEGAAGPLRALALAAVLLLLISCANVANLLLARASRREREFAVRAALGAQRARIVRLVFTESLLLGMFGATAGLVVASVCLKGLRVMLPLGLRSTVTLRINAPAVLFAVLICFVSAIVFGLLPFLFESRRELSEPLKSASQTGGAESVRHRLRGVFVASEVALAFVVWASAGLVFRSFRIASQVNPGFDLNRVLTMRIELSQGRYSNDKELIAFFQRALSSIQSVPGVASAAAVFPLPFTSHGYPYGFYVEGQPVPSLLPSSNFHFVTPGYFHVMGIPVLQGRDFSADDSETSPRVAIISQNFAARYWPGSDAIGKRIHLDPAEGGGLVTVIGVVGNTKESGLDTPTTTELYLSYMQTPAPFMTFVIRASLPPLTLSNAAVAAIRSVNSIDPVYGVHTMNEYAADVLAKRRTNALLLSAIGLLIITLSAIGVYAVISYDTAQRTHEIGVRMALGAQPGSILQLVFKSGAVPVVLGMAIGVVASLILGQTISGVLFGISDKDPVTFATVAVLLALVALTACYIPARLAMKVDPLVALRHE
jgi:putative ABC transport system permease protein